MDNLVQFESAFFTPLQDIEGPVIKTKIWKCPVCKKPYTTKPAMYQHIYDAHMDLIPEGMSAAQFAFNIRNKKTFRLCRQCHVNKTKWNEEAERYEMFCGTECTNAYSAQAKKNMLNTYGKTHILDDPKQQQKMMDARSISGEYRFEDGIAVPYMGSYEFDFLRFLDTVLGLKGSEVIRCPAVFEYNYNGEKHVYIPDYYLPNFNLIVEIKASDNNHPKYVEVDRVMEAEKDKAMKTQKEYNYVKIFDKKYNGFMTMTHLIVDMAWDDPEFKSKINGIVLIPTEV